MKKELNWNDKILGLSLIKVRDFLRYRKFKSINNQDVINFFKGEVKEKPFIDKLVELDLIKKITKKHLNSIELEDGDSSDIGSYRLTEFGIRLTTKKKVKQRDKKYCDKLIEEIKLKAYELNRIDACPVYISEIKVFGSYLTKKEDELLNDLDISVKIETKEKDIDLYEKCCDFCKAFNITPKSHNYWMFSQIDATYSFLQNGIGNKNSFLHILSHSDIKDEWKTKIVFSDKLDLLISNGTKLLN